MLTITMDAIELYDETKQEFVSSKEQIIKLEHSLASLSKWESKWGKPFLSKEEPSFDETIDYIRCMTITRNVDSDTYKYISKKNIELVSRYIDAPMTATTFAKDKKNPSRDIITSELIYYWMISLNIPFECENWHLNRLLTLINVCNIKNQPTNKMSKKELMSRNAAINAARKQSMNTTG